MALIAQRDILIQSTGQHFRARQPVGEGQIPPKLLERMLAEGVLAEVADAKPKRRRRQPKPKDLSAPANVERTEKAVASDEGEE